MIHVLPALHINIDFFLFPPYTPTFNFNLILNVLKIFETVVKKKF
ncbi:MAG: hypothetical protein BAJALOKI3v1_290006 [Promethearchaeota archaeon]|nr:MAG: hypothetical protein BAJALOKI3v1_290006 [Candidatus Lokiarchaeota archaeon]